MKEKYAYSTSGPGMRSGYLQNKFTAVCWTLKHLLSEQSADYFTAPILSSFCKSHLKQSNWSTRRKNKEKSITAVTVTKNIQLEPCKLLEHKRATEDQILPLPLAKWQRASLPNIFCCCLQAFSIDESLNRDRILQQQAFTYCGLPWARWCAN